MSFSHLASKLSTPFIAATAVGVGCSNFFVVGNTTLHVMGVLPYVTSGRKVWTAEEKLEAWKFNYDNGKKLLGVDATLSAIAYTVAALLTPVKTLRPTLWVAAFACAAGPIWTLTVMKSTNKALLSHCESYSKTREVTADDARDVNAQLKTWQRFNGIRIGILTVGYATGIGALLLAM